MRQTWRWLSGLGVVTAVGASLLGQGTAASAGTAAVAGTAAAGAAAAPARAAASARAAARAAADVPAWVPVKKKLTPGMHGADVEKVQRRLRALKYYPGKIDGVFGPDTEEAVWAFKEVQGLRTRNNPDDIGGTMEGRLASPRAPRMLISHPRRNMIEISLKHEYLVLFRHGKVRMISHVSTGGGYYYPCPGGGGTCGPAITPTGDFDTLSFFPGWVTVPLGEMYNPVFFIGTAYAIHGDTVVPRTPASHGCVRIPMDVAAFFHDLVKVPGTPVYIRDR
jgi:hypothetical protein